MSYHYYRLAPSLTYDPAVTAIAPNNAAFGVTDFAGSVTQDAGKIRLTRPISDGQGYEHCAPGARVRFRVTLAAPGDVEIDLAYTGLVTRTDTYRPAGDVLVNGAIAATFTGSAKGSGDPHPVENRTVTLSLAAGVRTIEVVFPYCAALDFKGIRIPATASVSAAPARTGTRMVAFGDSITHGFNATRASASWPYLVAAGEGAQILNLGYGSRTLQASDGTLAGSYGADFGTYLIGYNDFYPNGGSLATFQANYETLLANWRAASTTAGKPNAMLYVLTPTWSDSDADVGTGPFAANSPTLEQYRQAVRDAVAAVGDPYVELIEGRGTGMPSGFTDGVHPDNSHAVSIAAVVGAAI